MKRKHRFVAPPNAVLTDGHDMKQLRPAAWNGVAPPDAVLTDAHGLQIRYPWVRVPRRTT